MKVQLLSLFFLPLKILYSGASKQSPVRKHNPSSYLTCLGLYLYTCHTDKRKNDILEKLILIATTSNKASFTWSNKKRHSPGPVWKFLLHPSKPRKYHLTTEKYQKHHIYPPSSFFFQNMPKILKLFFPKEMGEHQGYFWVLCLLLGQSCDL